MTTFSNGIASGWWICGPAHYTAPLIPKEIPENGFVYGLLLSTGAVKVGKTRKPYRRFQLYCSALKMTGETQLVAIGLSHPCHHYAKVERLLHSSLIEYRIQNELYRCTLDDVSSHLYHNGLIAVEAGGERAIPESIEDLGVRRLCSIRRGRRPTPWFRKSRNSWYAQIDGRQIRLGKTRQEADARLALLV